MSHDLHSNHRSSRTGRKRTWLSFTNETTLAQQSNIVYVIQLKKDLHVNEHLRWCRV